MDGVDGLGFFFDEITSLVEEAERQYGLANLVYTEYVLERFEMCIVTCINVRDHLRVDSESGIGGSGYCSSLNELIGCLRKLYREWEEHHGIQESLPTNSTLSYRAPLLQSPTIGLPRFEIMKDQLLYLSSLAFKWTEIAALLSVSRMTLYR